MVRFFPDKEFITEVMRPKPTEGELALLKFLNEDLGKRNGEFDVYFQGKINGYAPDVVIMRKNHGVIIIEVKDWTLSNYAIRDNKTWTCIHPKGGVGEFDIRSPIFQANTYRDEFFQTYSRTLAEVKLNQTLEKMEHPQKRLEINAIISKAVFFYGSTENQLKNFFGVSLNEDNYGVLSSNGVMLFTLDRLQRGGLWKNISYPMFFLGDRQSKFFNDEIYTELDRILRPSEQSKLKYADIKLNPKQRLLAQSRANVKQKVRGPAGCGKTLVMSIRAVNAYKRTHQPVVILTFNITLRNHIRDCISAILGDIPKKGQIMHTFFIIDYYHNFIRAYRRKNDYLDEVKFDKKGNPKDTYALQDTSARKYQTILVDEVQDFQPSGFEDEDEENFNPKYDVSNSEAEEDKHAWVDTIHRLLEKGGELVFFGDEEQNIYQNKLIEENGKKRIYTGIGGNWNSLDKTYRLNGAIANLARAFQLEFFSEFEDNKIESAQQLTLSGFDATIDYRFVPIFNVGEIFNIFLETKRKYKFTDDDVCIMAQFIRSKKYGQILLDLDKQFRDSGYSTITTFEKKEDYKRVRDALIASGTPKEKLDEECEKMLYGIQRTAKMTFQMGSGKIKLSTIHSYKGWGVDTEILILSSDGETPNSYVTKEMVYTAITRAVNHLVIINVGNSKYDEFFRKYLGIS